MTDARKDLGAVAFNLHTAAAAVAALPAAELRIERIAIDLEARRHAVQSHDQSLAV